MAIGHLGESHEDEWEIPNQTVGGGGEIWRQEQGQDLGGPVTYLLAQTQLMAGQGPEDLRAESH